MKRITAADLESMDKLARVQFATSLPGVKPICLVGTKNSAGQTNLAPFSSIVHLGSNPALLGMVTRPDTGDRHTLSNILELGCYTLNHLHPGIVAQAHQCSARYPREISEFDATGLTAIEDGNLVWVKESRLRIALTLVDIVPITANDTQLIIGSVQCVELPSESLSAAGDIDFDALELVSSTALDTYFTSREIARLPYAKPSR
jgi:flavin reductase (DIM6/NTAB) family NADH-FMN oxidoreductase RutF